MYFLLIGQRSSRTKPSDCTIIPTSQAVSLPVCLLSNPLIITDDFQLVSGKEPPNPLADDDWTNPAELGALVALVPKVSQLLHRNSKPQPFPCGNLRFASVKWSYPHEEATRTSKFTGAHWPAWKPLCNLVRTQLHFYGHLRNCTPQSFATALESLFKSSQHGVPISVQSLEVLRSFVPNNSGPSVEHRILQDLIAWQATTDEANEILQARSNPNYTTDQDAHCVVVEPAPQGPQPQMTTAIPPEAAPAVPPSQPTAPAPVIVQLLEVPTLPIAKLRQTEQASEPAASAAIVPPLPIATSSTPLSAAIIPPPPADVTVTSPPVQTEQASEPAASAAIVPPLPIAMSSTPLSAAIIPPPPANVTVTSPPAIPLLSPAPIATALPLALSAAEKLRCMALYDNIVAWANKQATETQKPLGLWMSAIESTFGIHDMATNHWNLFQKWVKDPKVAALYEGAPATDATSSILNPNQPVMETHCKSTFHSVLSTDHLVVDYKNKVRKAYSQFKEQCPDLDEWEQIAEADIRRHHISEVSGDPNTGSRRLRQLAERVHDLVSFL